MPFWRDPAGCAGAVVLLLEDHPLDQRRLAAAVLLAATTRPTSGRRRASPPTPGAAPKPSAVSIDGSGSAGTLAASHARASAWKASSDSDRVEVHQSLPQLGLQHLAGQVAGEHVDELDLPRHLEVRQPLLGERDRRRPRSSARRRRGRRTPCRPRPSARRVRRRRRRRATPSSRISACSTSAG